MTVGEQVVFLMNWISDHMDGLCGVDRISSMFCCGRVNDEKDARCYLQALAAKMTDELDSLKMSGTPAAVSTFITFSK